MIPIPETLPCTKCHRISPLRMFHFTRLRDKLHVNTQCNLHLRKDYSVKAEARNLFLSSLWKMVEIKYLPLHEVDYEYRRRYETFTENWLQLKEHFDILDNPTDTEMDAIVFLHLHKQAEDELLEIWAKYY